MGSRHFRVSGLVRSYQPAHEKGEDKTTTEKGYQGLFCPHVYYSTSDKYVKLRVASLPGCAGRPYTRKTGDAARHRKAMLLGTASATVFRRRGELPPLRRVPSQQASYPYDSAQLCWATHHYGSPGWRVPDQHMEPRIDRPHRRDSKM